MRIAIVSDAGEPQVNGVVNTLRATSNCLRNKGHEVLMLAPRDFRTFACPTYPEIRLAYKPYAKIAAALDAFKPDCIHISTEGPMGLAARRYCLKNKLDFTTAYHTRFPEYLSARKLLPKALTYRLMRWFHGPSKAIMVPTPKMKDALEQHGFRNVALWGRGVDTEHFKPAAEDHACIVRPLFLYVGRVAVEKNIEAFLKLDLPGSKWVIGDGPQREELEQRYPQVRFLGAKGHDELPAYYNCADVFVFPSRTDTFGLVLAEAMACGVPVAAYPVEGPIDVVADGFSGALHEDLDVACMDALHLSRDDVRTHAMSYSWDAATQQFLQHLHFARNVAPAALADVVDA
ncbi:alpha-mannosyltransferase [Herbaspirillum sp. meg3]|uniref:glycosyltransferase family 4 protein n=1 Tax=Herbaspirillum sp. meg3 TaxID=2025949 RepID=UPI000B99AE92|nr:glycosyltransferase family 1 protein [Herbaspirillum sp. meg3]ASU37918.1 alpha-mannosyltransferase [Herbaspirillum sp. meg3]